MGLFSVGCRLENQQDRTRSVRVQKVMVDAGRELTWISHRHLEAIGVEPEKKNRRFIMANRQEIIRSIGFAIIRVREEMTTDEIVFARDGDLQLLGARTLEGLNVKVDSPNKRLVASGPVIAADNIGADRGSAVVAARGPARPFVCRKRTMRLALDAVRRRFPAHGARLSARR